jgi:hypothetical protein
MGKRTRSQIGRLARTKGAKGERQACEPMRLLTGTEWERSARQSRALGGEGCPDLVPVDGSVPTVHAEIKLQARPRVLGALEQATEDAAEGAVPVALVRRDRGRWVLAVAVEDFERLVRACGWRRG